MLVQRNSNSKKWLRQFLFPERGWGSRKLMTHPGDTIYKCGTGLRFLFSAPSTQVQCPFFCTILLFQTLCLSVSSPTAFNKPHSRALQTHGVAVSFAVTVLIFQGLVVCWDLLYGNSAPCGLMPRILSPSVTGHNRLVCSVLGQGEGRVWCWI